MDYGARRMDFGGGGDFTMKIARVSKRYEAYLAGRFKYVPDPNIICSWLNRPIGSEARSKQCYRK